MNTKITTILLLTFPLISNCQILTPIDAESVGLGNTVVLNQNPWASIYNPACISGIRNFEVGISYFSPFHIQELRHQSIALALPHKNHAYGLSYNQFGYELFRENRLGFAFALQLGNNLYAGIELARYGLKQGKDYGSGQLYNSGLGILSQITPKLSLGFSIQNIGSKTFDNYEINKPGVLQKLGLKYKSSEESILILELEKNSISAVNIILGIQYQPHPKIIFRTGLGSKSKSISSGMAYLSKNYELALSDSYDRIVGHQPCISIIFKK